jgi:multidrug resistance protein, MATE family
MRTWWNDAQPTLTLAVPMIFGQLGQMLMPLIDAAMVGRLGVTPLAAVAFGNLIVWIPMIAGFGICVAVHVLVASAHASDDRAEAGEVLRHGLGLAVLYGFICSALLQLGLGWLDAIPRVEPEVIAASKPFIIWIGWSIIPVLGFTSVKNYCEAQNRAWVPLAVLLASIVLNVFLNVIFIYGHLGVPAMGVAGAGLATFLSRVTSLVVLLIIIQRTPALRAEWKGGVFARLGGERLRRMLALGGPSAGQILFEVGVFNFATLLAGMLGKVVLDAHQITLNIAGMAYMVPLALSQATGIRVSQAMGVGRFTQARRIGWASLGCATVFMAGYAVFVLLARHALPHIFLRADAAQAMDVMALSSTLLLWAAAFAIFDGAQIVSLGILRGMHDVRVPLGLSFAGFWLVAAPLAWYWSFSKDWGGPGIWSGLFCGEVVVALLLVGRFAVMARRHVRLETLAKQGPEGIERRPTP